MYNNKELYVLDDPQKRERERERERGRRIKQRHMGTGGHVEKIQST